MTILLTDGSKGLFDILGRAIFALDTLNVARLTTVPVEVQEFIDQYKLKTGATSLMDSALSQMPAALQGWQSGGSTLTNGIRQALQAFLIEVVNADAVLPSKDLTAALQYLIDDMTAQTAYVDANGITPSLTADAGNSTNDLIIAYSTKRGDGRTVENAFAENIAVEVASVGNPVTPSIRFRGQRAVGDALSQDWPLGSGADLSLSATDAANSLLPNGDFQDASDNDTNVPDGWIVGVGTPGTHIVRTVPEAQTVILSGTPTSGQYYLRWVNPSGIDRMTAALAFDAGQADVQTALQAIPGLESVDVVTTGSSPNYTHTITFTGVAGNINQLTSVNGLNTGAIAHATTVAGSDNSYKGVALGIVGSAVQPALYVPLSGLVPEIPYVIHFRQKKTGTPAAGVVRLAIVDEIAGVPTQDPNGADNSVAYDLTTGAVTTSFASGYFFFRLKKTQTQPCYFQIITTTPITAGTSFYIDECAMVAARELYAGGPYVAAFSGKSPPIVGDLWTITLANDRAGQFQTAFDRLYDLKGKGLLLPIAGASHISDGLIA